MSEPFTPSELLLVRRAYARQILTSQGITDAPLESAFSRVARERFLGDPPWKTMSASGEYRDTPISDPVAVYQDLVFALDPARGVNNGSPSLHAHWLHAIGPRPGERVFHIGAGAGYYTAILAELVGPDGSVVAVERDPILAAVARANLEGYKNVRVVEADGTALPDAPADCVYVNFGVERPMAPWVEALHDGGRLVFPLGFPRETFIAGGGFMITRDETGFAARFLGRAYFIGAEAAAPMAPDYRDRMRQAFLDGQPSRVRRLIWHRREPQTNPWFAGETWALCEQ
ncbi:protein-L-isoaspartate O-methyltransferase family protein [Lichenicoccus sp.]|uniref:protein-L-isoaspartate O-methyltransferase family protein n=1 Tax=Lichenicoccus sp. TaxID=2781899 RepID=UPI003D0A81A8